MVGGPGQKALKKPDYAPPENGGYLLYQFGTEQPDEAVPFPRVHLGIACKLRSDPDQERDRVNDSKIWQLRGDGVCTLKKIAITRHEVFGLTGGGQIQVRLVLWGARKCDRQSGTGSGSIHTDRDSSNSSDVLGDYRIRQLWEFAANFSSADQGGHQMGSLVVRRLAGGSCSRTLRATRDRASATLRGYFCVRRASPAGQIRTVDRVLGP